jgi:subtilase family serine protease
MRALNYVARGLFASGLVSLQVCAFAVQQNEAGAATPGLDSKDAGSVAASPYVMPANVFKPESSIARPGDAGVRAHTNYVIKNVQGVHATGIEDLRQPPPADNPQSTFAEYPASLSCLYKMGPTYAGCAPMNNSAYNATGGNRAIAVVIAFDNPTVGSDLKAFSTFFGLPAAKFKKVIANGNGHCTTPAFDAGWALEGAMDTQWAHAMAPKATIIYVEACTNSYEDLMYAEQVASSQLLAYGGGQVTNSWSSGEFASETDWDYVFRANWAPDKPISYFFSAGDSGLGAEYPSASPWVVSAGGTTINRDPASQAFTSESCWAGSGGGTSVYETYNTVFGTGTGPWTNYQYPLFGQAPRHTPDVSFDADPASGAFVLYNGAWYVVGGTSLSAPALAGIVNNSNNRQGVAPSGGGFYSNMENNLLYAQLATYKDYGVNFYDVTTGSNGAPATVGWDSCTGVGSPRGKIGK